MLRYLQAFMDHSPAVELRAIGKGGIRAQGTFNNPSSAQDAVSQFGYGDWSWYHTINPFECGEVTNAMVGPKSGFGSSDAKVRVRAFISFDLDPVRPPRTAGDEAMAEASHRRLVDLMTYLASLGWGEAIKVMSGSGWQCHYRCDMPNNDEYRKIIDRLYEILGERFSDSEVKFDVTVRNPSRIMKLPRTKVWYEDGQTRVARYIWPEAGLIPVPHSSIMLASIGEDGGVTKRRKTLRRNAPRVGRGDYQTLHVKEFFDAHGLYTRDAGDDKHIVKCPWEHEHTTPANGSDTVVMRVGDKLVFKCQHAHCAHRGLLDVAAYYSGDIDKYCEREFGHYAARMRSEDEERKVVSGAEADDPEWDHDRTKSINDVARRVIESHVIMKVMNGGSYEYDGVRWSMIDSHRIAQLYSKHEHPGRDRVSRRREGVDWILKETTTAIARGAWNAVGFAEVPFLDGVMDVRDRSVRPHRKEDYLDTVLPFRVAELSADMPTFDRAMTDWFGGEVDFVDRVSLLQEFFGQVILPHNAYKKALILYGDTDTGKSQLVHAMETMVGMDNVAHLSISDMGNSRMMSTLVGKLLNTISDLGRHETLDDGGFKRLTGGDEIQVDPKYVQPYSYTPIATHVIATNNLPKVDDRTSAVYRRLIILKFNKAIPRDSQDRLLSVKLRQEASAIVNWAIDGAKRLIEVGDYTRLDSSEDEVQRYRYEQNDGAAFIKNEMIPCEVAMEFVKFSDFRDRLIEYGIHVGMKTARDFVRAAGYEVVWECGREVIRGLKWR